MDTKISITIDLSKIDKSRITERTYTNAEGVPFTAKEYKMDVVPLRQTKVIKEGPTWAMVKKYFVVQAQTKEERAAKESSIFLGDGIVFVDTTDTQTNLPDSSVPF